MAAWQILHASIAHDIFNDWKLFHMLVDCSLFSSISRILEQVNKIMFAEAAANVTTVPGSVSSKLSIGQLFCALWLGP